MSWLYSRALVEAFLPEKCSDGEPSAPSNGNPTQLAYLPPDKMTDFSRLSRFGVTFKPLTENLGEALLTSYLEGFPAKTLAPQDEAQESKESDQECGSTWRGSLAKFDQDSRSWKTAQCSVLGGWEPFLETWPRWGLMRNGECWEQTALAPHTNEIESGLWPTPRAQEPGRTTQGYGRGLAELIEGKQQRPIGKQLPTPTARIWKGGGNAMIRKDGKSRSDMLDWVVEHQTGMRLNPTWVEWLMGWPLGWTDLKPLEMDKSLNAPPEHGNCCSHDL